jgi:hypothetical protein
MPRDRSEDVTKGEAADKRNYIVAELVIGNREARLFQYTVERTVLTILYSTPYQGIDVRLVGHVNN